MILWSEIFKIINERRNINLEPNDIYSPHILVETDQCYKKEIIHYLNTNGYCILRFTGATDKERALNFLQNQLGQLLVQNIGGMREVYVTPVENATTYINTNTFQPLHTDNGYSKETPAIVSMYCLKQADTGGESLFVNMNKLYEYLIKIYNEDINILYDSNAITYIKNNKQVKKCVFYKENDNVTSISYSPFADAIVGKTKRVEEIFLDILRYAHKSENQSQLLLKENEALIIDNGKLLHGRKAFQGERIMVRTWYNAVYL